MQNIAYRYHGDSYDYDGQHQRLAQEVYCDEAAQAQWVSPQICLLLCS